MERTLSPDERIRRAEELYYQKRIQANSRGSAKVNAGVLAPLVKGGMSRSDKGDFARPNTRILRRMLFQVAICVVLYFILYMVQGANYIFSKDIIGGAKDALSYDINFQNLYNGLMKSINGIIPKKQDDAQPQDSSIENAIDNAIDNTVSNDALMVPDTEPSNVIANVSDVNATGGADVSPPAEPQQALSQMELDAQTVKTNYSVISPLQGIITLKFGELEPNSTKAVPKYHTGIDIAVNEGTVFIAAMSGTVTMVSSQRSLSGIILR